MSQPHKVVVLGANGNFGKRICATLSADTNIQLILGGRDPDKLQHLQKSLQQGAHVNAPELLITDIHQPQFKAALQSLQPDVVIHTAGPFQGQDYTAPQICIDIGAHYIDLADGRRFVCDIKNLHQAALDKKVLIVSGASSVPGLSGAVIDHYVSEFRELHEIDFGIIPGNKAERGIATLRGILSYVGHPFQCWINNQWQDIYGWAERRCMDMGSPLGKRWLANVDIPDLELFPARYPGVNTVRFQAGLELGLLHNAMVLMSALARWGIVKNWARYTKPIFHLSHLFDRFGTDTGGMFIHLSGINQQGKKMNLQWKLIARNGVGPYIPTIAAIIIARKLAENILADRGAMPCLGLFSLEEFFAVADTWGITQDTTRYS